jgi:hypothetical protein
MIRGCPHFGMVSQLWSLFPNLGTNLRDICTARSYFSFERRRLPPADIGADYLPPGPKRRRTLVFITAFNKHSRSPRPWLDRVGRTA